MASSCVLAGCHGGAAAGRVYETAERAAEALISTVTSGTWPVALHVRRSPLGDLIAQATAEGRQLDAKSARRPLHGYYFKILTAQSPAALGGAVDYVVGRMTGGFALVAWPAVDDSTGVMTIVVGSDGIVRETDLGPDTVKTASAMRNFNPDPSWPPVQ